MLGRVNSKEIEALYPTAILFVKLKIISAKQTQGLTMKGTKFNLRNTNPKLHPFDLGK